MSLDDAGVALLVAGVSGLTLLAYRHPPAYRKLHWPLMGIALFAYFFVMTWAIAVSYTHARMLRFIDVAKWPETDAAMSTFTVRNFSASLVFFGSTLYLTFLYVLPMIINDKKKDKNADPDAPENPPKV